MRRYEAHGSFWLLRKDNRPTDETHTPKQRTNSHCSWSPSPVIQER